MDGIRKMTLEWIAREATVEQQQKVLELNYHEWQDE
jgi:hypothetical protein